MRLRVSPVVEIRAQNSKSSSSVSGDKYGETGGDCGSLVAAVIGPKTFSKLPEMPEGARGFREILTTLPSAVATLGLGSRFAR